MADVFENRPDLKAPRSRLFDLIDETQHLDWLLLTKRIHLVRKLMPGGRKLPKNVWLGTTVENQEYAAKRIPFLLSHTDASVRFLSCEPLLGPLDLRPYLRLRGQVGIDWVIAGGESGPHSRPMHPGWAEALQQHCRDANIPFHFKQWGHWAPLDALVNDPRSTLKTIQVTKGTRRIQLVAVGKSAAGRLLKGRTWDQLPKGQKEIPER